MTTITNTNELRQSIANILELLKVEPDEENRYKLKLAHDLLMSVLQKYSK